MGIPCNGLLLSYNKRPLALALFPLGHWFLALSWWATYLSSVCTFSFWHIIDSPVG